MGDTIRVLDIAHYMMCPPKSGGVLRMISPLTKMDPGCGITIDFLFGTYDREDAFKCCRYLERIPVVGNACYAIFENNKDSMKSMPKGFSDEVWKTMSRNLLQKAVELLKTNHYDIIQLEHSFLAWMVPFLREASPDSKLMLDAHNAEYRIFELWNKYEPSAYMGQKAEALKNWEYGTWGLFDGIFTVSSVEEEMIRRVSGVEHTYLVPTGGGIDASKYAPDETNGNKQFDILYIGTMEWFPNAQGLMWFMEKVLPIIENKRPGTGFHIIGSGKPNQKMVNMAEKNHHVDFLGFQPDDVYYFHNSRVFIVPLWIGGGARVKIPTAWAAGIPVVSTTFGAEGNYAEDRVNILLADDPESFAEAVLEVLDNPALSGQLVSNALDTINTCFTTEHCAKVLIESYRNLVGFR